MQLRGGLVALADEHQARVLDEETRSWAIEDVLDAALTTTGAEVAEIFLREADDSGVSLAGFRGLHPEAFNQITHFKDGQGYPGLVVAEGRPLKASDVINDGRFLRTKVKELGYRYFLCVPVPGNDRPAGCLAVAWRLGSEELFAHCVTLSRDAERLALMLEHDEAYHNGNGAARAANETGRLDFRVLGNFEVYRGERRLSLESFARRRAIALLKILLTNYGKVVVRDELVDLLWPSDPPKDAAKLLKIAVHYLRRGLGEPSNARAESSFILTESNGYAFNISSNHRLDALEFENAAKEGLRLERSGRWREASAALRAAAEFYGGDYLEDDPYSDWCLRPRRRLRELMLDVLLTTARLLRTGGDLEGAIRSYRRTLELDPCLEDVHRDLMEVLSRRGRRTQALRQFDACRRALKEEFDAVPALETEALYRSILGRHSQA